MLKQHVKQLLMSKPNINVQDVVIQSGPMDSILDSHVLNVRKKNPLGGIFDIVTGTISPSATEVVKTVYKVVNPFELAKMITTDLHAVDGQHHISVSKNSTAKVTHVDLRKTDLLPN
eukprot:900833_1